MGNNFVTDFGGVGDDTTDNASAFTAAEASSEPVIYLPDGTYYATSTFFSLNKQYDGPGLIRLSSGDRLPGRYSFIDAVPAGSASGLPGCFAGDQSHCQPQYQINGGSLRISTTEPYYSAQMVPHWEILDNRAGSSGALCRLTAAASSGSATITVNSTDGVSVGQVLGLRAVGATTIAVTRTVSSKTATTITFTATLGTAFAIGSVVTDGLRTMHSNYHTEVYNYGGGDTYCHVMRVTSNYVPKTGQDDTYYTSTAGLWGGDISATQNGNYIQTSEVSLKDNNKDIMAISDVRTFTRDNDTGARNAKWIGTFYNSSGAKYADVCHVVSGKWNIGLDTVKSLNANIASVNMAVNNRIVFNSSFNNGTAPFGALYGNVPGNTYMYGHSDNSLRITAGGYTDAAVFGSNGTMYLGYDLVVGNNLYLNGVGGIIINGATTITGKATGWGAVSGTVSRAAFNSGTATLATVAQTLAALITDLKAGKLPN